MIPSFNTEYTGRSCVHSYRVVLPSSCYEGLSPNFRFSPNPDLGKGAQAKHPLPSLLLGGFAILNLFFLSSWEHSLICLLPLPPWPIKGSLVLGWWGGGDEWCGPRCCCPGAQPTDLAPIPGSSEEVSPTHLVYFNLKRFLVYLRTLSLVARK